MTKDVRLYLVGGAVRDHFRGVNSKDWDFAVEAESFDHMRQWLIENNFVIFAETPKYFTLRARAPKDKFVFGTLNLTGTTFDFTLCREEKDYEDGRHPNIVTVGTILDDLSRRDFTMNAVAIDKTGRTIDPFSGVLDIQNEIIRCVGSTERLKEDGLRIFRAIRFKLQTGFQFDEDIVEFLDSYSNAQYVENISVDRVRDELTKCFKINNAASIHHVHRYIHFFAHAMIHDGLWLKPTTESK